MRSNQKSVGHGSMPQYSKPPSHATCTGYPRVESADRLLQIRGVTRDPWGNSPRIFTALPREE
jgi:hypothetical protein